MSSPEKKATDKADSEPPALLRRSAMNNNAADVEGESRASESAGEPTSVSHGRGAWGARVALQFTLLGIHIGVWISAAYGAAVWHEFVVRPLLGGWPPHVQCVYVTALLLLPGASVVCHILLLGKYLRRV